MLGLSLSVARRRDPSPFRRRPVVRIRLLSSPYHRRFKRQEDADAPHAVGLLRARSERPRRRAAEERDELAASHSMITSAMASNVGGTISPSAFADLRLITSSNLVGCITGRSAGFSPLRMRPV